MKPDWLKIKLESNETCAAVRKIVETHRLHTICSSGRCPNIGACWSRGTATFLILGNICTRSCRFCATPTGRPLAPDPLEPQRVAESIRLMQLRHCVVTSVDRDDLPDRGAGQWAATIRAIRVHNPGTVVEVLIPDFDAHPPWLDTVIAAAPDIIGHNLETVERLTPAVRSRASYCRSLEALRYLAGRHTTVKSGLMLGLGERPEEVLDTLRDAHQAGVRLFTIGQYLQPTPRHLPVAEYIPPTQFAIYKKAGLEIGFDHVESGPLVRSSYKAEEQFSVAAGSGSLPSQSAVGSRQFRVNIEDWGAIDYKEAWERQRAIAAQLIARKIADRRRPTATGDCPLPLPTATATADCPLPLPTATATAHCPLPLPTATADCPLGTVIFCEHPHVYTLGRNGKASNLLIDAERLQKIGAAYYPVDRGGDITYHGPGQLVCYPVIDLERRPLALKDYVALLEEAVIRTLRHFGLRAERLPGATGVWLDAALPTARKIAAIGVHASHYVTTHGLALNINTDLNYYRFINPCGFTDRGVTSMAAETGRPIDGNEVKQQLQYYIEKALTKELRIKN
jgi:lipoic acid synthetase